MKKYKLIKEYPGSPKLGTTIINDSTFKSHYYVFKDGLRYTHLGTIEPYKYLEFWEEIVEDSLVFHIGKSLIESHPGGKAPYYIYQDKESYCKRNNIEYFYCKKDCKKWADKQVEKSAKKEYEILSYQSKDKIVVPATNFGVEISKSGYWDIHSIKRLPDGEVFTVGDSVNGEKIDSFVVNDNAHGGLFIDTGEVQTAISSIKTSKELLFTTEDGVNIYSGMSVYCVGGEYRYAGFIASVDNSLVRSIKTYISLGFKYFSTREAAIDYIVLNKPINLSLKQIKEIIPEIPDHLYLRLTEDISKSIKNN